MPEIKVQSLSHYYIHFVYGCSNSCIGFLISNKMTDFLAGPVAQVDEAPCS